MREIRLHDTRTAARQALVPRDPGRVGIYACGPTVYDRIHVGNARPFVVFSLLSASSSTRATRVTLVVERHRRQRQDLRRRAPRRDARAPSWRREMTAALHGRHRPARARPARPRAAGDRDDRRDRRPDRGADRPRRAPTPSQGDVYFRVRARPRLRRAVAPRRSTEMDQGEGDEPAADAARRIRSTSRCGRRRRRARTPPGTRLGPRAAGLAHRVLGDGRGRCSALGFDIHGGGNDLVFPHHENEAAQTRAGARRRSSPGSGCTTACCRWAARRWPSRVGNIAALHDVRRRTWGRDALILFFAGGHYRQPIAFSDERTGRGGRARGADPRGRRAAWSAGPSPEDLAPLQGALLRRAGRRLQHARRRSPSLYDWVREANRASRASGTPTCARCSACSALDNLLDGEDGGRRRR